MLEKQPPLTNEELAEFRAWLEEKNKPRRIIVGISGASMPQYGIRTVGILSQMPNVETHLVVTSNARLVMRTEMGMSANQVQNMIDGWAEKGVIVYGENQQEASISSGSFKTEGLLVIPCSVNTLALIANGFDSSLIARAARCCFKERRKVVLVYRETPYDGSMLRNMTLVNDDGGIILPPVLAFYHGPKTIEDIVDHGVGKALDQFGIDAKLFQRWETPPASLQ